MLAAVPVPRCPEQAAMNLRILISGVLGGILAVACLSFPLFILMPSQFGQINPWEAVSMVWGVLVYVLAVVVGVGTGYVAARWSWAESAADRVRVGAVAGLLAALVAFP